MDKSDRATTWVRLKRILRSYGCEFEYPTVGNRINLQRTVESRKLGMRRNKTLKYQVAFGGDGTEAEINTVHTIRKELELDEDHGIDSKIFYGDKAKPDDFIQDYRTLLRRLAKF